MIINQLFRSKSYGAYFTILTRSAPWWVNRYPVTELTILYSPGPPKDELVIRIWFARTEQLFFAARSTQDIYSHKKGNLIGSNLFPVSSCKLIKTVFRHEKSVKSRGEKVLILIQITTWKNYFKSLLKHVKNDNCTIINSADTSF